MAVLDGEVSFIDDISNCQNSKKEGTNLMNVVYGGKDDRPFFFPESDIPLRTVHSREKEGHPKR